MILWVWIACGGVPLTNQPPVLDTVNGEPVNGNWDAQTGYLEIPEPVAGEVLALEIDAHDPEGDAFQIWFPGAPGTVDFDPADRSGTWTLPNADAEGRIEWRGLDILLYDPDHPEASSFFQLSFVGARDSGDIDL